MSITARRLYGPSVLAGIVVGGFAFFAAGRVWGTTEVSAAGLPSDTVTVTGTEALPVVGALALVIVAGSIAVLAASARFRRIVGVVLTITGLVGAVLAFR
ncbi:MAG TPA: Trp biosynthesis-associated membrane protein, partial [Coriobacteriia bacterium]|nr:Trp biosynthesis-associated membrane protein [Coriobacteriia bacterium]